MQNNGLKIGLAAIFLALSLYYLYPTVRESQHRSRMESMSETERETYMRENFSSIESSRARALKLGLDLRGGMLVSLEVRVTDLLRALAEDTDATFNQALSSARERTTTEQTEVIDAFMEEFEKLDPNYRLSRYYRNTDRGITRRSSNEEVREYLAAESNDAVNRAIEIIRQRIDRFGVTEPSIQKQGTRRLVVELPGVDDPERVRDLLRGTARLEFRLMADPQQANNALQAVMDYYERGATAPSTDTTETDLGASEESVPADSSDLAAVDSLQSDSLLLPQAAEDGSNRLLEVFQPTFGGVRLGVAAAQDTAEARRLLFAPGTRDLWPTDMTMMWSSAPVGQTEEGLSLYDALAVRSDIEMQGDVIVDATPDFDQFTNEPKVSMTMNSDGARTWARLTGANVGKNVAIVMDNVVYSYPVVREKIAFGRSEISGLESQMEAQDLVTLLKSGALPAPVDIVAERTVGPSLGSESIHAGTVSLVVGTIVVAVFMALYYQAAGLISILALFLNIFFIFGILAGFNATLTLPGIAGIVLTIGMAVDANVLIFERIREEQSTGKTLKAAVAGGYGNALSAILDANITTFLVAAILFSFGKGPIQGFAVTLMAGILSSLFTAIIVTRIVFDWLVSDRHRQVSIG